MMERLKPMFKSFEQPRIAKRSIKLRSDVTEMPKGTAKTWRKNIKRNRDWHPSAVGPGQKQVFSDVLEDCFTILIRTDLVSQGKFLPTRSGVSDNPLDDG
jgi:hypothetical protein